MSATRNQLMFYADETRRVSVTKGMIASASEFLFEFDRFLSSQSRLIKF
jgi:hypothetical protein